MYKQQNIIYKRYKTTMNDNNNDTMRMTTIKDNNNNDEPALINQGGYGCVYYPSFPENKKSKHEKKYLSKLQKNIYPAHFEDFIGKILKTIPGYENFFVPVLKTYSIDLASVNHELIEKCDAVTKFIKKNNKKDEFREIEYDDPTDINTETQSQSESQNNPMDYNLLNKNFVIQKMIFINGATDLKKYIYELISIFAQKNNIHQNNILNDHEDQAQDRQYDKPLYKQSYKHNMEKQLQSAGKKRIKKQQKRLHDDKLLHKYINKIINKEDDTNKDLERFKDKVSYKLISIIFDWYERILDCIHLLGKYQIVHNDLKYNNVLINRETITPIVIDFGLSIYIKHLLDNPWRDKNETGEEINENTLKPSTKGNNNNFYWKQHFYVHAPDYYLWCFETHIISFLIIETETNTLSYENLRDIAFIFTNNNEALTYMSREFKYNYMNLCISVYKKYIDRPREEVINELIQYWRKWDVYSHNVMFIRLFYSVVVKLDKEYDTGNPILEKSNESTTDIYDDTMQSGGRGKDNNNEYAILFDEKNMKIKSYYFLNDNKIIDILEFMMLMIHPDPEKRLLPEDAKKTFNTILYYC
jgi:serine/threonine protein kinase